MEQTVLVALIIGLVEVVKRAGLIGTQYAPLLALVIGVGLSLTSGLTVDNAIAGIIAALISSGLYDVGKKGIGVAKNVKAGIIK